MDGAKYKRVARTAFYFFLAGLFEIGGGYLVWLWIREDYAFWVGLFGGFILFLYGIVPTLQPSHFHRIYAAYGGVFVVMSMLWGWVFDSIAPDMFDIVGALVALVGVSVIFYWPRKDEATWEA